MKSYFAEDYISKKEEAIKEVALANAKEDAKNKFARTYTIDY